MAEVTQLLLRWSEGDQVALEHLMPLVYDELRGLAGGFLRQDRLHQTLQPTALVNELYLKLFAGEVVNWKDRAHFFAVAARQLRRILIDHARGVRAQKRGAGETRLPLLEKDAAAPQTNLDDVLDLSEALTELEALDPRYPATDLADLACVRGVVIQRSRRGPPRSRKRY